MLPGERSRLVELHGEEDQNKYSSAKQGTPRSSIWTQIKKETGKEN